MKKFLVLAIMLSLQLNLFAKVPTQLKVECTTSIENEFEGEVYHKQVNTLIISAANPQAIVVDDPRTEFANDFFVNFTYNLPPIRVPSGKKALTVSIFHNEENHSTGLGTIQLPFDAKEFSLTGYIEINREPKWVNANCKMNTTGHF